MWVFPVSFYPTEGDLGMNNRLINCRCPLGQLVTLSTGLHYQNIINIVSLTTINLLLRHKTPAFISELYVSAHLLSKSITNSSNKTLNYRHSTNSVWIACQWRPTSLGSTYLGNICLLPVFGISPTTLRTSALSLQLGQ